MYNYSITKYKGKIDENIYKEWGAISDIGKIYNGKKLTMDEYKKTEDAYIEALFIILKYMNIKTLKLKNMSFARYEHNFFKGTKSLYSESMLHTYNTIQDGDINLQQLEHMARLKLREDIGGFIYVPYRFKLFIGYDYLMSVRTSVKLEKIYDDIEKTGLFIYNF